MEVRGATDGDWEAIWPFFREIVRAGETYAYDPEITESDARELWMVGPPGVTFVAVADGRVIGSANAYANRPGAGSHVASASFMVDPARAGRGAGQGARGGGARLGARCRLRTRCSSTPWSRRTSARWGSGARWVSR